MRGLFMVVASILVITVVSPMFAQAPWTVGVDANLTLTQNAYSDN